MFTGGVRVDGSAECFLNTSETGIPQLRRYCHLLTASSHRKSAFRILKAIKALAQSIRTIINSVSDEAEKDQDEVRHTWESRLMRNVLPGETIVLASNAATGGIAVRLRKVGLIHPFKRNYLLNLFACIITGVLRGY